MTYKLVCIFYENDKNEFRRGELINPIQSPVWEQMNSPIS